MLCKHNLWSLLESKTMVHSLAQWGLCLKVFLLGGGEVVAQFEDVAQWWRGGSRCCGSVMGKL